MRAGSPSSQVASSSRSRPHVRIGWTELLEDIAAQRQLAARMGLWGRRVVGEEIGSLLRILARSPELLEGGMGVEQFHAVLSAGATSRMRGLGLRV